jgi:hypothetical protein
MKFLVTISLFIFMVFIRSPLRAVEAGSSQDDGEILVTIHYVQDSTVLTRYTPSIQLSLLDDRDPILAHLEQLREQSKGELEPLVKQYMQIAETLTRLAVTADTGHSSQETKAQFVQTFKITEKAIETILERYRMLIDARLQHDTIKTLTTSCSTVTSQFENVAPGAYRLYGVMTFATTTLRWFEPIVVKGGGCYPITLTRENLLNPYWTDLNWWSFMNLDFSKHHEQ